MNNVIRVGTATVIRNSQDTSIAIDERLEATIGFVAFQYELDDGTNVYGYRGTDRGFGNLTEIEHGFITSAGIPNAQQSLEAVKFFNKCDGISIKKYN